MEDEKDLIFHCNQNNDMCFYNIYKINKNKYYVLISNMIEEYFTSEEESFNFIKSYIENQMYDCENEFEEYLNDYNESDNLDDIFYRGKMLTLSNEYINKLNKLQMNNINYEPIFFCHCKKLNKKWKKYKNSDYYNRILILTSQMIILLNEIGIKIEIIDCEKNKEIFQRIKGKRVSEKELECYKILKNNYTDLIHQYEIKGTRMSVDYYSPTNNLIIEFLGDYYHGNPNKFKKEDIHPLINKTYGEIHEKTFERLNNLIDFGYNVKYIWEEEYEKLKKEKKIIFIKNNLIDIVK